MVFVHHSEDKWTFFSEEDVLVRQVVVVVVVVAAAVEAVDCEKDAVGYLENQNVKLKTFLDAEVADEAELTTMNSILKRNEQISKEDMG